jgi:phosphatidylserine synthase
VPPLRAYLTNLTMLNAKLKLPSPCRKGLCMLACACAYTCWPRHSCAVVISLVHAPELLLCLLNHVFMYYPHVYDQGMPTPAARAYLLMWWLLCHFQEVPAENQVYLWWHVWCTSFSFFTVSSMESKSIVHSMSWCQVVSPCFVQEQSGLPYLCWLS